MSASEALAGGGSAHEVVEVQHEWSLAREDMLGTANTLTELSWTICGSARRTPIDQLRGTGC